MTELGGETYRKPVPEPSHTTSADTRRSAALRIKGVLDLVVAAALLVLLLPVMLVAMLAIKTTSRGPVFFRQVRVGRHGREFIMHKLRTMRVDAEASSGPVLAERDDARVTPVGRVLRSLRLDELPQLWNVLNGTMSLVGPRPERPEFAHRFAREIEGYRDRWLVKPGITGLAQIRGDYHASPAFKLKYDLDYIHNYTLGLDGRILFDTVKILLERRGV